MPRQQPGADTPIEQFYGTPPSPEQTRPPSTFPPATPASTKGKGEQPAAARARKRIGSSPSTCPPSSATRYARLSPACMHPTCARSKSTGRPRGVRSISTPRGRFCALPSVTIQPARSAEGRATDLFIRARSSRLKGTRPTCARTASQAADCPPARPAPPALHRKKQPPARPASTILNARCFP